MLLLALGSCLVDDWTAPEVRPVVPGAPVVGAAEGFLKLPAGTPLGGYSVRCSCLTGQGRQDERTSSYTEAFVPSTGVHTHPAIKVIWLENGDDHLVIAKTDGIYSYDGLVEALELRLGEATGLDLDGRVVHTTNHSHSSYGDFSDQITFYLGTDKYDEEIFQRFVGQVTDVALQAYEVREPARIGMSITDDWDPDDRIYSDRRGDNDELVVGEPPLDTGKDPRLALMRFDALDGRPLAVLANYGMHGIVLSEQNSLVSSDSGGGVEAYLQESFDERVVVMFTQGSGGDQSPRGEQDDFARIESLGERAAPILHSIWDQTPTAADAIAMQTASRSIPQHPRDAYVTRNGTVDWRYAPYDPERTADDVLYDAEGALQSPIDEFNTDYGAVFCGTGDLDFPVGKLEGTEAFPYTNCLQVELLGGLISVFFDIDPADYGLDPEQGEFVPLPIPDTLKAGTTASRLGPISVRGPDGSVASEDVLFAFMPGEPTHMYNAWFRRRAQAELGVNTAVMFGYSQDHEGYLLIPEDWLAGGYEPDIGVWGPLQGEHVLERTLEYSSELLFDDVHQDPDPFGLYQPTTYPVRALPERPVDATPDAGTRLTTVPEFFWVPDGVTLDLTVPAVLPRVQGLIQLAWKGGDPAVDEPIIALERQEGAEWVPVTGHSGRPITDSTHDILKGWTPDPLRPFEVEQDHLWWTAWQAVGHVRDRAGLPLGTYRLRVTGQRLDGPQGTWPWDTAPYEVISESFEVVPGALDVQAGAAGLSVSLPGPASGWRYVAAGGSPTGENPAPGPFTVTWTMADGSSVETVPGAVVGARTELSVTAPVGALSVTVEDAYGNVGALTLP